MILERLNIGRQEYDYSSEGKIKGRYYGEATFQSPIGRVQLNLGSDASDAILKICAGQVMDASRAVADAMSATILPGLELNGSEPPAIADGTAT